MMDAALALDAVAQGELIRRKQLSSTELVEAAIERVERINPQLNAVVIPMYDQAIAASRQVAPMSPLSGIPFLLKDLIASVAGVPQTEGSVFLRGHVADHDSELVARLKRGGLVLIGKTNTPEFGNMSTTEPQLYGATRNPWAPDRTTGGSSGGSAAAVAARLVPIAHGNDGGGSIRIPASCCGVFGLKPTRGRNPLGPAYGDIFCGLVAEHALSRSVRDLAALLDLTGWPAAGDPHVAPASAKPFLDEVKSDPGRLRILFSTKTPRGNDVHPDCLRAVTEAATLCAELGHEIVEALPVFDVEQAERAFFALWAEGNAWLIDDWARRTGRTPTREDFEPLTWALQEQGRNRTAAEHLIGLQDLQGVGREIASFLGQHDVWLTPTLAEPPLALGAFDPPGDDPLWAIERDGQFSPFTWLANITGQPAMSVPLFWNADGLPIGSHFVGRFGDEATLFRLAAQLEHARPWSDKSPPIDSSASEES